MEDGGPGAPAQGSRAGCRLPLSCAKIYTAGGCHASLDTGARRGIRAWGG